MKRTGCGCDLVHARCQQVGHGTQSAASRHALAPRWSSQVVREYLVEALSMESFVSVFSLRRWTETYAWHRAAERGDVAACRSLAESATHDVNSRDRDGLVPLHWAAISGHADLCRDLVMEYGANVSAVDTVRAAGFEW